MCLCLRCKCLNMNEHMRDAKLKLQKALRRVCQYVVRAIININCSPFYPQTSISMREEKNYLPLTNDAHVY